MSLVWYYPVYLIYESIASITTLNVRRFFKAYETIIYCLTADAFDGYHAYKEICQKMDFPRFSFPSPVMVHASTGPRGYQSDGQRGFNQTRDTSESSDDDADGDHSVSERNGGTRSHEKLTWKQILSRITDIESVLCKQEAEEARANVQTS